MMTTCGGEWLSIHQERSVRASREAPLHGIGHRRALWPVASRRMAHTVGSGTPYDGATNP